MFLEDKLQQALDENKERKANLGATISVGVELLNVCVAHIGQHIKPRDTWRNVFSIVKQTDNVWRTFAKKKGFNQDLFRNNYIVPRLADKPGAKDYFHITQEEVEHYAK